MNRELAQADDETERKMSQASQPRPEYFVGHDFSHPEAEGLREVIPPIFQQYDYTPYAISKDKAVKGESTLLRICRGIFSSRFSIVELSTANPNAYLEIGIALALNRLVIPFARQDAPIHHVLQDYEIIRYSDPDDLKEKLTQYCAEHFPLKRREGPNHCYFCRRECPGMAPPPDKSSYLVLNKSKLLWRDVMGVLEPYLAETRNLTPVYLTDPSTDPALCTIRSRVLTHRFTICHLGDLSDELSFLAFGMAAGSRSPWLLLSQKGIDPVPSDLHGLYRVEYQNLRDPEGQWKDIFDQLLDMIVPRPAEKVKATGLIATLPFWIDFETWIDTTARAFKSPEAFRGRVRIVQYEGAKYLSELTIPEDGLVFGRERGCDMVVDHQAVSAQHFRILKGRGDSYFVEDLNSKNGTFLNGARLAPGEKRHLSFYDTIRIVGAQFVIWDERPLPEGGLEQKKGTHPLGGTGQLGPSLTIDLPDIAPPEGSFIWDHPLVLKALHPDSSNVSTFATQAYYPMGTILAELVKRLNLPKRRYHFKHKNRIIDDKATPWSLNLRERTLLEIYPEPDDR